MQFFLTGYTHGMLNKSGLCQTLKKYTCYIMYYIEQAHIQLHVFSFSFCIPCNYNYNESI